MVLRLLPTPRNPVPPPQRYLTCRWLLDGPRLCGGIVGDGDRFCAQHNGRQRRSRKRKPA